MKKNASIVWKGLLLLAEAVGLGLGSGLFEGAYKRRFPYMFTNLSNMAVFAYFLCALIFILAHRKEEKGVFAPVIKHAVTMSVTMTLLISHFFLFDALFAGGHLHVELIILHYVTPLMTILDWAIFDPKGTIKKWEPPVWLVLPLGYLLAAIVAIAGFGSDFGADVAAGKNPYPYPFIDLGARGAAGVTKFVVLSGIVFVLLGYLVYAIDWMLGRVKAPVKMSRAEFLAKRNEILEEKRDGLISILVFVTIVFLVFYSIYIEMARGWQYYKLVEMISKTAMDVIILGFAVYGTVLNPRKRNLILLQSMIVYAVANEITTYFIAMSAPIYIVGHILLIYNLSQTGRIRRVQRVAVFALTVGSAALIFAMWDTVTMVLHRKKNLIPFEITDGVQAAVVLLLIIYMMILWMKLSFSLGNRFYWMSAVFFTASDIMGALSILKILHGQKYTVVLLYYLAIMFYAVSTFNCTEKEVVTFRDVFVMNSLFRKSNLRYFIYGKWALHLSTHRYAEQTDRYEIAYDVNELDEMKKLLLKKLKFELRSGDFPVEAELYSERYGYLTAHGVYFDDEGGILWLSEDSEAIEMDARFFRTVHYLDYEIPCLFPAEEGEDII